MLITMPVAPGDILVLGSDGLFDNLADADIVDMVEEGVAAGEEGVGGGGGRSRRGCGRRRTRKGVSFLLCQAVPSKLLCEV